MDGRSGSSESYRYGFQGQEMDDEVKGKGNSVNYKYRMHDPRIGRFFAVDPLEKVYTSQSTYVFAGNNPVLFVDIHGLGPGDPKKGLIIGFAGDNYAENALASVDDNSNNENYDYYVASDIEDALDYAKQWVDHKNSEGINGLTVVFRHHGAQDEGEGGQIIFPSQGGDLVAATAYLFEQFNSWKIEASLDGLEFNLDYVKRKAQNWEDYIESVDLYKRFELLGESLGSSDQVVFGACWGGLGESGATLGKELRSLLGVGTLYMNQDMTSLHISANFRNDQDQVNLYYSYLDIPLTTPERQQNDWIKVTAARVTNINRTIMLNSSGRMISENVEPGEQDFARSVIVKYSKSFKAWVGTYYDYYFEEYVQK